MVSCVYYGVLWCLVYIMVYYGVSCILWCITVSRVCLWCILWCLEYIMVSRGLGEGAPSSASMLEASGVQNTLLLLLLHRVGRLWPEITVTPPTALPLHVVEACWSPPNTRSSHSVARWAGCGQPAFNFKWQDQRTRRCAHEPIIIYKLLCC